jgi:phosphoenolpyruvate carboxykinase (GTP)
MGEKFGAKQPRIFHVNWFRKDGNGKFFWPGFGENLRVLLWIIGRCRGTAGGRESPLGIVPRHQDIDWRGLDYPEKRFGQLMSENPATLGSQVHSNDDFFAALGEKFPPELRVEEEKTLRQLAG